MRKVIFTNFRPEPIEEKPSPKLARSVSLANLTKRQESQLARGLRSPGSEVHYGFFMCFDRTARRGSSGL